MCHSRVLHCFTMVVVVVASEAAAVGCRAAAAVAAVRLPPCPTQSSCRWQCHCNANIGIETFFSTEATDSLSLYPPKSSGVYRDGGIFPYQIIAGKYFVLSKQMCKIVHCINFAPFFYDCSDGFEVTGPNQIQFCFRRACPPSIALAQYYPLAFFHLIRASKVELRL